jgi:putative FmdB family regulatory protein
MPIYTYECKKCGNLLKARVSADEEPTDCSEVSSCEEGGEITKCLSRVNIRRAVEKRDKKTGELTKEYIEENRKILQEEKESLANRILD